MGCSKKPQRIEVSEEPWGLGWIIEDVWVDKKEGYETWEPHVQAIKNEDGDLALRFCYWKRNPDGTRGGFVNSAMFVYDRTIDDLREEAKKNKANIILMLFKKLAE
ncbi:MAG: hypothetical protein NO515_01615 [Candidatus Methanomethylicia archaeon]|nr:hypothetical protein [Candidatus Methanomethylicia archaeon]